jgi:hypothetical protein
LTLRGQPFDVHNSAVRFEVGFVAPQGAVQEGDAYFKVRADRDIKTRHEGGTPATKIFAASIFFDCDAAIVAAA